MMKLGSGHIKQYRRAINRQRRGASQETLERLDFLADYIEDRVGYSNTFQLPIRSCEPMSFVGLVACGQNLEIVAPVCPPKLAFDGSFCPEISPEAEAAINSLNDLVYGLGDGLRMKMGFSILVADTEYDLPRVRDEIGRAKYQEVCQESAELIQDKVGCLVTAATFSSYFGDRFHETQYEKEIQVRTLRAEDSQLESFLCRVSEQRAEKHCEILGRVENDNELAIRYVAQYATMGAEIRNEDSPFNAMLNYQTPNIKYVNHDLAGPDVVPVFESRRLN